MKLPDVRLKKNKFINSDLKNTKNMSKQKWPTPLSHPRKEKMIPSKITEIWDQ